MSANCLAAEVLSDVASWVGTDSLSHVEHLLTGAWLAVGLSGLGVPNWRVHGPMHELAFNRPLVARAGGGMWRAPSVMELLHVDQRDAIAELKALVDAADPADYPEAQDFIPRQTHSLNDLLITMAGRPGMYFGQQRDGWALYCCLQGMSRGAAWLGVPSPPELVCTGCSLNRSFWQHICPVSLAQHPRLAGGHWQPVSSGAIHLSSAYPLAILRQWQVGKSCTRPFSLAA